MNINTYQDQIAVLSKQRNSLMAVFLCSLVIILLLSVAIINKDTKVVVVPTGFSKELHISSKEVSTAYIEEMTHFFANNLLDVTPENFGYRKKMILRHVAPASYQKISQHLDKEHKQYKEYNLCTSFSPQKIIVDNNNMSAVVKGILFSTYGKSGATKDLIEFNIKFEFKNGMLLLREFGKRTNDKIEGENGR